MRRISENDALARVSARFGRSQGLPRPQIFDVFRGINFRCVYGILFFRFFVIFSDFGTPSGFPLGDHWHDNWMEKADFLQQGSWEGPRE